MLCPICSSKNLICAKVAERIVVGQCAQCGTKITIDADPEKLVPKRSTRPGRTSSEGPSSG
jgi:hypothetical protein